MEADAIHPYLAAAPLCAFDVWLFPEKAEEHSFFLNAFSPALAFTDFNFNFAPPELSAEYMPPFSFPLSLGIFIGTPEPNLKHFGIRAAGHINIDDAKLDLYFLYVFDFGWIRNDLLVQYHDTPVSLNFLDFRAGVRRFFGRHIALCVETATRLSAVRLGVSFKLN